MTGRAGTAGGIRAGDRLVIDDRPVVVLGASGTVVRFAGDDGVVESASIAELAGSVTMGGFVQRDREDHRDRGQCDPLGRRK